jgi:lysophospholipase L1-like esterase
MSSSILCFGDSNTFGTAPMHRLGEERRWPFEQRWPGVLQASLGSSWRVIEEGLPGRTIGRDDPIEGADRNALRYLPACLQSHRPLDAVVFMLGTNDFKARFNADAQAIAHGVHGLLDAVVLYHQRPEAPTPPRILVISPAPLLEQGCLASMFTGAQAGSPRLAQAMAEVCRSRGVDHLDAGQHLQVSPLDGVHLDADSHHTLGQLVAAWVRTGG